MHNAIVISGRLMGPRTVQLDEPVTDLHARVEVIVRSDQIEQKSDQTLADFLKGLPVGVRSREDIDEQLKIERSGWETRP